MNDAGDGLVPPFAWRAEGELTWIEAALPGGRAVFSTRRGGLSKDPYSSLNLGILTDDDPALVAQNRTRLALALERDPEAVAMGWQVHGANVQRHTRPPRASGYARRGTELAKVDAQATDHPEVTPIVLTADCVPLALVAPGAVAMVHCGWRGVAAGIAARAVEACCELAGSEPDDLDAALGPGIGPCCYVVGDDVRRAFEDAAKGPDLFRSGASKAAASQDDVLNGMRLDLPLALQHELERAGVRTERIAHSGLCTSCHADLFFSHRRESGITGRQAGLVWLE